MINFKKLELADKQWIDNLCNAENSRSADFCFGSIYLWDLNFHQAVTQLHDRLIVLLQYTQKPFFAFPAGSGELGSVIESLIDHTGTDNFIMRGVTAEHKATLEQLFPGRFRFEEDRPHFDYIYLTEKMATLSGRKLHGKRNHINRFIENNPDWSFEPLTLENIPECIQMLDNWSAGDDSDDTLKSEHDAILRGFDCFTELGLEGGLLRSGGQVIAFTVGELLSSDTYIIHFEKAFSDIQGAYPMISREFSRLILDSHPEIKYLNREDDMGQENQRVSKLSYYPDYLLEKYIVTLMKT